MSYLGKSPLDALHPTITALDGLRDEFRRFRDLGLVSLTRHLNGESPGDERWDTRPDAVEDALLGLLFGGLRGHSVPKSCRSPLLGKLRTRLCTKMQSPLSFDSLISRPRNSVPTLWAAISLRGLLHTAWATTARMERCVTCFFVVARALNFVQAPDYRCGSARADDSSPPSAFITHECTRAIRAVIDRLEHTITVVRAVDSMARRMTSLQNCGAAAPRAWLREERYQAVHTAVVHLANHACHSTLQLSDSLLRRWASACRARHAPKTLSPENLSVEIEAAIAQATRMSVVVLRTATTAVSKRAQHFFRAYHQLLDGPFLKARHQLAYAAPQEALGYTASVLKAFDPSAPWRAFERIADGLRKLLRPAAMYLESVLDRQLATSDGKFDAAELAFSANGYAAIRKDFDDERLSMALTKLQEHIVSRSKLRVYHAFQSRDSGHALRPITTEVYRAFSQLASHVPGAVDPRAFAKIQRYFVGQERRTTVGGQLYGWSHDSSRQPPLASRWATVLGIQGLHSITQSIDRIINHLASRIFVTPRGSLSWYDYVWPDHGLARMCFDIHGGTGRVWYPATQDTRRFLGAVSCDFMAHLRDESRALLSPASFSAVFYGPPGTGKTTLMQTIASVAGAPCYVVTPSDLILGGSDMMEARARAVFEVLRALRGAVIIFDEFDPVLMRRSGRSVDSGQQRTVFAFLTESMLPKLADLYVRAKSNGLSYVLLTNRVGMLDKAAIRDGRFDIRMGIYPPDLVARLGYMAHLYTTKAPARHDLAAACAHLAGRTTSGLVAACAERTLSAFGDLVRHDDPVSGFGLDYRSSGPYGARECADLSVMRLAEQAWRERLGSKTRKKSLPTDPNLVELALEKRSPTEQAAHQVRFDLEAEFGIPLQELGGS